MPKMWTMAEQSLPGGVMNFYSIRNWPPYLPNRFATLGT